MNYDQQAREAFKKNPNTCISYYMSASYAYYRAYESLLSDSVYDKLCLYILNNYDKLEHIHKHLVDVEALRAGTGYQITDYPTIVIVTAEGMIRELLNRRNTA